MAPAELQLTGRRMVVGRRGSPIPQGLAADRQSRLRRDSFKLSSRISRAAAPRSRSGLLQARATRCRRLPYLHDNDVGGLGTDITHAMARTGRKREPGTRPVEHLFGPI